MKYSRFFTLLLMYRRRLVIPFSPALCTSPRILFINRLSSSPPSRSAPVLDRLHGGFSQLYPIFYVLDVYGKGSPSRPCVDHPNFLMYMRTRPLNGPSSGSFM